MGLSNKYIKLLLPAREAAPLINKVWSRQFRKHLANTGVLSKNTKGVLSKNTKGVLFKAYTKGVLFK